MKKHIVITSARATGKNEMPGLALRAESHLLKHFEYSHLPPHLQKISKPFHVLARKVYKNAPYNLETTEALRKLLEAKDCAVRAAL